MTILYDYLQGKKYTKSFETLSKCFGDTAPSIKTVYNWFKEFGFGRRSLEDSDRLSRAKFRVWVNLSGLEPLILGLDAWTSAYMLTVNTLNI